MKRGYLYPPAVGFWPGLKPCQGFQEHPPRLTWFPDRFHLRPRAGGQAGSQRITPGRWRRAGVAPLSPTSLSLSLSLYTHTVLVRCQPSKKRTTVCLSGLVAAVFCCCGFTTGSCVIGRLPVYKFKYVSFLMSTIRLTWEIIGVRFWEFPNFLSDKPITWARVLVNVLNALIQLLSRIVKQYKVVFLFNVYDNSL